MIDPLDRHTADLLEQPHPDDDQPSEAEAVKALTIRNSSAIVRMAKEVLEAHQEDTTPQWKINKRERDRLAAQVKKREAEAAQAAQAAQAAEMAKTITTLTAQVAELTKALAEATKTAQEPRKHPVTPKVTTAKPKRPWWAFLVFWK